jgi:uncharacterized protein YdhG (YjbR/CyaY superfamily)
MQDGPVPTSIDEYLSGFPDDVRGVLEALRQTIQAAAPEAVETISYRMPAFKYHGILLYFAAFTHHCSLFPGSKATLDMFREELAGYPTSQGATIQFTVQHPLPAELVTRIVHARVAENEARAKARAIRRAR